PVPAASHRHHALRRSAMGLTQVVKVHRQSPFRRICAAGKALPGPTGTTRFDGVRCAERHPPWSDRAREVGPVEGSLYDRLGGVDAFLEALVAVLDDLKVGKAEQDELLSLLRPMRDDIVAVDSSQVGPPLPSAFAPAPPL